MLRLLLLVLFSTIHLSAAPAFQGKKTFFQDDGTFFSAHLQGDEYLNWVETDNEDILLFNKESKQYEHAMIKDNELKPSGDKFTSSTTNKKAPAYKKLNKSQLKELWKKRRQEAFQKRRSKQVSH